MFKHEFVNLGYDDLTADTKESGRTYLTPDGNKYPSVTTVLSIINKDKILAWRARVGAEEANRVSSRASKRGSQVHDIIERYLRNEECTREYLPHIIGSLQNIRPILDKSIGVISALEAPLFSSHLGVAGRVDCVAEFDGVPSIIDFKTSKRFKRKEDIGHYFAQLSAYAIMWEERTGKPIVNTVLIMDVDDNRPVVFKEHRDNYTELLLKTIKKFKLNQKTC